MRIGLLIVGAILILLGFGLAFTILGVISIFLGMVAVTFGVLRSSP